MPFWKKINLKKPPKNDIVLKKKKEERKEEEEEEEEWWGSPATLLDLVCPSSCCTFAGSTSSVPPHWLTHGSTKATSFHPGAQPRLVDSSPSQQECHGIVEPSQTAFPLCLLHLSFFLSFYPVLFLILFLSLSFSLSGFKKRRRRN
jgi:hypothetical protein